MDNSSMRNTDLSSCPYDDQRTETNYSFEESGWTMYFEDFFAKNNNTNINDHEEEEEDNQEQGSFSIVDDHGISSDLVSDAASSVVKKSSATAAHDHETDAAQQVAGYRSLKSRLSFKKRKTKVIAGLVDDSLEDTASSPVNSPKVYDLMNQCKEDRKQKDNIHNILQEKCSDGSRQEDETSNYCGCIGRESDTTQLRKRGLCLVPLSMVLNYLG